MSIKRIQTKNFATFVAFIQENLVPSIFKTATYNSETGVLTCTDDEDNTALEIKSGNIVSSGVYYFRAYRTTSSYIGLNFNAFPNASGSGLDVIACDNGLICTAGTIDTTGYGRTFCFMITKTNNGKPAIIFGNQTASVESGCRENLQHVAFGDSTTISTTTTFPLENGQQTNFCAFCTNANITEVSYTPKAFYLPMHSAYNSGIGKFLSGGKVYITNGYWAIDTE